MRNNLLSLKNTSDVTNKTQHRLATGKKVNTPLDNPTNFFAAQSHNSRASDLLARKDGMNEAVQTAKAADAGIKAMTSLIEAAQSVAQSALTATTTLERNKYSSTFDTLLAQISQMASDSGYRGINFLAGGSLMVEFAPVTSAAKLQINGFDATSDGLSISKTIATLVSTIPAADGTFSTTITATNGPNYVTANFPAASLSTPLANLDSDYTKYRVVSSSSAVATIAGYDKTIDPTYFESALVSGSMNIGDNVTIEYYANGVNQSTGEPNPVITSTPPDVNPWTSTTNIQLSSQQLESALTTLRTKSTELSANQSVITTRQAFTDTMINTLTTGADNLTLADMNEEGANMLMLQTRQNLGVASLSIASQAAQAVLRLL